MKKLFYFTGIIVASVAIIVACQKAPVNETFNQQDAIQKAKPNDCVKIQDGILVYGAGHYLEGQPLETGFDVFGTNYQGHMFNESYANNYLGRDGLPPYEGDDEAYLADYPEAEGKWYWPYRDVNVLMKWNDAWLSNKDCDNDGSLDRHYGFDTYIGSGAWLTNHQSGTDEEGHWTYFVKIKAADETDYVENGYWYTADGVEIGPVIWGSFAIILEVYSGEGAVYVSPAGPGFGN
jgi:hypothetical protein